MNILITGSSGFIGSYFTKRYLEEGHTVVGIDNKEKILRWHARNHGSLTEYNVDCRDYFRTKHEQFDLVIHAAAFVGGRAAIEGQSLKIATEDFSIDALFFDWVARTKPKKVIYWSSSAAYPISLQESHLQHKLKEEDINLLDIRNPDESYGMTKMVGEIMAKKVNQLGHTQVYVFRPFSGYGETQNLDYPFPSIIQRVVNREDPMTLWSNTTRDFIHIQDIYDSVNHIVKNNLLEMCPLNLGLGIPISFTELVNKICEVDGWKPSQGVKILNKPKGVDYRVNNPEKFFKIYTPKITLEKGISKALDYYRNKK